MILVVQNRTKIVNKYDLDMIEGIIGTRNDACVKLENRHVLPVHAIIEQLTNGIIITPASDNAIVYLNAQQIESSCLLNENDIINIGEFSMIVQPDLMPTPKIQTPEQTTKEHPISVEPAYTLRQKPEKEITETLKPPPKKMKIVPQKEIEDTANDFLGKYAYYAKVLIVVFVVLGTIVSAVFVFNYKKQLDYNEAKSKIIELYSRNDYAGALDIAYKFVEKSDPETDIVEWQERLERKMRFQKNIEDANEVLKSSTLQGYEESVAELHDNLYNLNNSGLDPSDQITIRKLLYDLERAKLRHN